MRIERSLAKARLAVACAEVGVGTDIDLGTAVRPVLEELLAEGALDRAVVLIARDDPSSRLSITPRKRRGAPSAAELLEEDHARLDRLLERALQTAPRDPARAQVLIADFAHGVRRHFRVEETLLFPWLREDGVPPHSTERMCTQHRAVLLYVARLVSASMRLSNDREEEAALDELRRAFCGVTSVLEEHNDAEERALFPLLDAHPDSAGRDAFVRQVLLF